MLKSVCFKTTLLKPTFLQLPSLSLLSASWSFWRLFYTCLFMPWGVSISPRGTSISFWRPQPSSIPVWLPSPWLHWYCSCVRDSLLKHKFNDYFFNTSSNRTLNPFQVLDCCLILKILSLCTLLGFHLTLQTLLFWLNCRFILFSSDSKYGGPQGSGLVHFRSTEA